MPRREETAVSWHCLDANDVLRELGTSAQSGLGEAELERRRQRDGRNELRGSTGRGPGRILLDQFRSLMILILLLAVLVSILLGDWKDATAIGAIVLLNALLGFSQEYRAEKAMAALRNLSVPLSRVRRSGLTMEVSSLDLVPGDIVYLEAGNLIAADGRVLESAELQTQESALTGESQAIRKSTEALTESAAALGDRHNMVYRGTFVTAGRGLAVITATGMQTELGRIASLLQELRQEQTPLQRRLAQLAKGLAAVALFLVLLIFLHGIWRGEEFRLMLLTAVSVAVAAVPEGLPAVVTIALTLGAQRMLTRKVLIRRLAAVESLGSVTVICTDKTGTLTENRMRAVAVQLAEESLALRQHPADAVENVDSAQGVELLLAAAALCNDALVREGDGDSLGDPTEIALAVAARRFGLPKEELERHFPRVGELPFDSNRKRMTTVHQSSGAQPAAPGRIWPGLGTSQGEYFVFTKGAVDGLLENSSRILVGQDLQDLDADWLIKLHAAQQSLAGQGLRVLGLAYRRLGQGKPAIDESLEADLIFLGMVGLIDPLRAEVGQAVETCRQAGVRTVMITGDHALTASYVGQQLGLAQHTQFLTGRDLEKLSPADLGTAASEVSIYARVSPEHKLKIVEALQRRGEIVAMTGDGVNDAPALKRADIGIAMGRSGTDVAKEAADIVLLDDNFATIVAAIEEGRVIFDNIRKFIKYILATNSAEIWLMLLAPLAGMPLPLLPLQLLWLNLVTDGLPALALGVEPPEENVMQRPPYSPEENIFSRGLGRHILWVGLLMGLLCLGIGYVTWRAQNPHWQTMIFTLLTFTQMAHVLAIRAEHTYSFRLGLRSNPALLGAVGLAFLLQLAILYTPTLQSYFGTHPLTMAELAATLLLSLLVYAAVEAEKWILLSRRARGKA